ncbi:MAG TPA: hypothetical protein VGI40_12275 [Pirellulaceae bacterium]|jgi:tetratricopeptide (TPR) repeat protein
MIKTPVLPSAILWMVLLTTQVAIFAQETYSDFNDAMIAAARSLRKNDYPAAVPPLEAALMLAKTDAQRLKAYESLVPAYRQDPNIDKMLEAQEFIIRHTDRRAGRSLSARDVVSSAFQRGKIYDLVARYDAQFRQNPQDPAALTILAATFSQTKRSDPRTPILKQQLEDLDKKLAGRLAQRLENDAQSAPRTSAWLLKDAATAWLEAGDKEQALATAQKSLAGPPENRNGQLNQMWHEGLGDVFLATGQPQLAVTEFEAALASASDSAIIKQNLDKKLAQARGTLPEKKAP